MAEPHIPAPMEHPSAAAHPGTLRDGTRDGMHDGIRRDGAYRGGQALVWGGVALGVAGLTAATVLSVRHLLARAEADGPETDRPAPHRMVGAPAFAALSDEEREAIRRRVRAQAREDYEKAARERAAASAKRHKRGGNTAKDLTRTATELTASLTGVATAVAAATKAFRGVSGQAPGIMGDFVAAADQLRAILNGSPTEQAQQPRQSPHAGADRRA